jgi:DNA-binding transcriptional regulator YiaG
VTIPTGQRVPNHALRAIRLGLRLSQSEFAAAVRRAGESLGEPNTCNKRLVQKWESGEHTDCRPNYKRALQVVTRTQFEQLGFGGGLLAPVQAEPAVGLAVRGAGVRFAPPLPVGDSAERLRFALQRPGHVDKQSLDIAAAAVDRLFAFEQHRPARSMMQSVNRQVEEISALLSGTGREPVRRRLAAIGGAGAALAGWLALESGDPAAAHRYLDCALASARYAADGPLLACTLVHLSYAAAERGDPATGWQLAHTAAAHAGDQPRVKAWAAARAAQEAARLGEHAAALDELAQAIESGGRLGAAVPGDGTAAWARFVDGAYLHAMAADVHGLLGEHDRALEHARGALAALSDARTKARALVLAQAACTAARCEELDLVVQCAYEAADLADALEHTLAWRRLRLLRTLIKPYLPTVLGHRLAERLSTLPE